MSGRWREWIRRAIQTVRPSRSDDDCAREMEAHLEFAEEELRRQGMTPGEAARLARVRYGRSTQAMEEVRRRRGFAGIDSAWLDVKLGWRMLRKHWGLTTAGGLAMALSMTLGASMFSYVQARAGTSLPFEEGERVVMLQWWNAATRTAPGASAEELARWREGLRSVTEIGAFRSGTRNLSTASGPAGPVTVAEMGASGFAVARVQPRLGRYLLPEDERPGASRVMVIGQQAWQSRFGADAAVVGKAVQLDGEVFTVAGVMPAGFGFPVKHQYWIPVEASRATDLTVFGRLAGGASIAAAQEEAAAQSERRDAKVRVVPYAVGILGERSGWLTGLAPLLGILLLLPPCMNVAALIYARTVARQGEFAARAALGASRGRIVAQIFIETLLLTAGSAALAMAVAPKATFVMDALLASKEQPFWVKSGGVTYGAVLLAGGLAIVAALIAGAVPAMRATGRWKLEGLHRLNRSTAPRLGRMWTGFVAAQVALSVAVVPLVVETTWRALRPNVLGPGFDAAQFLTARLSMDRKTGTAPARFAGLRAELAGRLRSEPGIRTVSMAESVPIEEDSVGVSSAGSGERREVALNRVDDTLLSALGARFHAGGPGLRRGTAVVNQSFVERAPHGQSVLGERVRLYGTGSDSRALGEYEITGIVADLFRASNVPTIYLPLTDADAGLEIRLVIRGDRGIPANATVRLREMAAALDPRLRVDDVQPLDEVYRRSSMGESVLGGGLAVLALCVVLFAVTGIYTLLAFTVEHRRREIGIRAALGAPATRLALGLCRSVLTPVAASAVCGGLAAIAADYFLAPILVDADPAKRIRWLLPAGELLLVGMAVAVLIGPVRRALRIDPVEALREG